MKNLIKFSAFLFLILLSCGTVNPKNKGKGLNLFSVQQDKELGFQVSREIETNTKQYPILDSIKHKEVYQYLYKIRNNILNCGKVDYKSEFPWRIRIIHDDKTLNAFCTPGGYIYVYTGIMKFMDSEDELAGVLAHEIGHADMRHSTRQMTKIFGIQVLLEILAGNRKMLKDITAGIISLKFSRLHETEADERSVLYLCPTTYNADGAAGFFEKIQKQSKERPVEFLSTHPNPDNRIEHFRNRKITMACRGNQKYQDQYKKMISKLPQ
ncbi:MAG: M48 family metalloprotease [Flavobacteriia bacterium]|nr:M48 family metalloprotease [Flavobacteriia bacterium]